MAHHQESSPIIVYGAPRSGTTYLREVLCSHPEVFISDEAWVFLWVHQSATALGEQIQDRRRRWPWGDPAPAPRLRNVEELGEYLDDAYPELVRGFYRALDPHARYWGDKHPSYLTDQEPGCLETILELFPDARFVHIVRDGRAAAVSATQKGWLAFDAGLRWWQGCVDRGSAFGRRLPPNRYFELRYEDLVADDVGAARELFAFLDIAMHPAVERFCRAQREARTPVSAPTRDLRQGAERSVWEEALTPLQRRQSLDIAADHLVRYGYETEASLAEQERRLAPFVATPRLVRSIREIVHSTVPAGSVVLVVSEGDDELLLFEGREGAPFPPAEGGAEDHCPEDGSLVVAQLEELRAHGASFLLVPRPAFWWLDYYPGLRQHLDTRCQQVWGDDQCLLYHLRPDLRGRTARLRRGPSSAP